MTTLHLGVVDFPYVEEPKEPAPVRKGKRRGGSRWRRSDLIGGAVSTTGDVAEILERKYHVMEVFAELHLDDVIAPALADSMAGALETLLQGGPPSPNPFGTGEGKIDEAFRSFLENGEIEQIGIPGIPTAASGRTEKRQGGVNHRLKHPFAKDNPARPSFIDTGTYQNSFKAWVTDTSDGTGE